MPSVSESQRRLFAAAEHGATFAKAKKLRRTMTHEQLHEYAVSITKKHPIRAGNRYHA